MRTDHNICVQEDGYITIDGVPVAHVGDDDLIYLNPSNWLQATRDMPLAQQGALAELIFRHRPGCSEVAS
jgi:hypothetical protein